MLAICLAVVYVPALDVPFIFDDIDSIQNNGSITSLWPLFGTASHPGPLNPPPQISTSGRPLVNFSFAINHYFGGLNPIGYHAVNLVIHFLCSLLLWATTRRTLQLPYFEGRFQSSASWLGLTTAMLWALHPLQTEAIIYATQRTELMFAFFSFATLYCSLRYWSEFPLPFREGKGEGSANERIHRIIWLILAAMGCFAGMASKESMVSTPLLVLLFERTFIAGSLYKALRGAWPLYLALAAAWGLLVALNISAPRSYNTGFNQDLNAIAWWLTQSKVLLLYLKLVVWPWPLLIHYQFPYFTTFADAWMYIAAVAALGLITLLLLWRNHPLGFFGTCIFAILSPTLLIPIVTEMAAERRMYLPLAAIVQVVVVGFHLLIQSLIRRQARRREHANTLRSLRLLPALVVASIAVLFVLVDTRRLSAYKDEMNLWNEALQYRPHDALAHARLAMLLADSNRLAESIEEFQTAAKLDPNYLTAQSNLGAALTNAGRLPEAVEVLFAALERAPADHTILDNLCMALTRSGRLQEAIDPLRRVLQLNPNDAHSHYRLGEALNRLGRSQEAIEELKAALKIYPDDPIALNTLGIALIRSERYPEAIETLNQALRIKPDYGDAHNDLGLALSHIGKIPEAIAQFRQAIKINSNDANAYYNLGNALKQNNQPRESIEYYQFAIRLRPEFLQARFNLIQAYSLANQSDEAIVAARQAIEIARAKGQQTIVQQLENWLSQNQAKVKRESGATTVQPLPIGPAKDQRP
jgi:protein O-mannosyl-transferase